MATPAPASRSRRRLPTRLPSLLTVVVALALALGGLTGLAPARASAQAAQEVDQITQREFDRLTRAAQDTVVFGPEDGTLPLDEKSVAFQPADVEVEDFLAHAEFTNPYASADGQWDYGFQFRSQNRDDFMRLILISDGSWGITAGLETIVDSDAVDDINDGEGDTNVIDLYVEGDIGHFGINGDYVKSFDLPVSGPGDISVGTGYLADSFQDRSETGYAEFIVWSLDEGTLGPDDLSDDDLTATAEAEDDGDLSNRDRTATARAGDDEPTDDDLTATAEAEDEDRTATAEAEDNGNLSDDDLTATAEAEDQRGNGDEPTYTSPTFGYTLSYDAPWEVSQEDSDRSGDLLELQTDASSLQLVGNESTDDTSECLDALVATVEDNADVSNFEVAQDDRDRDLRDDSDELSWVVLFFTIQADDGSDVDLTGYYECRTIVDGESLLTVIHLALSDDYNDEIENRTAVTDTIEVDGGGPTTGPTRRRTPTPTTDDEPTEEATQESDEPTAEATTESDVPEGTVTFILDAVGGSGLTVFGNIEPDGANASRVILIAFGASGQTVTIHEGTCRAPGDAAFELGEIDESSLLDQPLDAAVEDVTNGDFVMLISTDGTEQTATACGVLEPLAE